MKFLSTEVKLHLCKSSSRLFMECYCHVWAVLPYYYLNTIMMMMMNCFCGMVDRRKAFSLISSRDHCQRFSPLQISDTPQAWFELAQNLRSGFVEWSCAVVITTTPQHHKTVKLPNYWSNCQNRYSGLFVLGCWSWNLVSLLQGFP